VLWRSENLANFLTKGKQAYVEGRLQTRSYEDRDGAKRYVTEIVVDNVILLGGQQGGSQDQPASGKRNNNGLVSQPRRHAAAASAPPTDGCRGQEITNDDIPFDSRPARFLT
jgi:single-strand DNA-binding protein